jgi:hypothetical protein
MFPRYVISGGFMFKLVHGLSLNSCDIDLVETVAELSSRYEADHVNYYTDIKVARLNISGPKTEIIKFDKCCPVHRFDFDFCKIVFDGERIKFYNFESVIAKTCGVEVSDETMACMVGKKKIHPVPHTRMYIRMMKYINLGCKFKVTLKELYG